MSTNLELVLDLTRARTLVLREVDHPLGSHHGLGLNDLAHQYDAVFLARLEGEPDSNRAGFPPLLRIKVTVEHPAAARGDKRRRLEFITKLP